MSDHKDTDRNLLYGVLAFQMDFLSCDQLVAGIGAWVGRKSQPLEEILILKGFLDEADCELLALLVDRHIAQHGGKANQSLNALCGETRSVDVLCQIDDAVVASRLSGIKIRVPALEHDGPATVSVEMAGIEQGISNRLSFDARMGLRYQTLRPHAKGGLGEVFVARDAELDREVALKEIQHQHADDLSSRTRFLVEAEITGKLEHPGIVPVYGLGCYSDGRPFYAMRFIKGDSLQDAIRRFHKNSSSRRGESPFESVAFRKLLGRFVSVCNAVGYAHSRGVLHRDIKPANVMLGKHGETLVVDWGLAKLQGPADSPASNEETLRITTSGSGTDATLPGSAIGTPGYMSPEQAEGRLDLLGPATDIYGLGATLYAILLGQKPIQGSSVPDILARTVKGEVLAPRGINIRIPRPLEAICQKAMSLSTADRYESCQALADDIDGFLASEPVSAYREPWIDGARRWVRKHRTLATSTLAAAAVALIGLTVGFAVVAGLNRQLDERNEELIIANGNEQTQRERAEAREQEAGAARRLAEKRLEEANKVAFELLFTVDKKLEPIGAASTVRRELLDSTEKLLESLLVDASDDPLTLSLRATQLFVRGEVAMRYEDLDAAESFFKDGHDIYEQLAEADPSDTEAQVNLSSSFNGFGDLATHRGNLKEAAAFYERAIAIDRKLMDSDLDKAIAGLNLSVSLGRLGELVESQGDLPRAKMFYEELVATNRDVLKTDPNNLWGQQNLSASLRMIGNVANAEGDFRNAKAYFEEALVVARRLVDSDATNAKNQGMVASSLNSLGDIAHAVSDVPGAASFYDESIEIRRRLVEADPGSVALKSSLGESIGRRGDLALSQGEWADSTRFLDEATDIYRQLAKADPTNATAKRSLVISLNKSGDLAKSLRNVGDAMTLYEEALPFARELAEGDPTNSEDSRGLAITLYHLGRLAIEGRDFVRAKSLFSEATEIYSKLTESDSVYTLDQLNLCQCIDHLGNLAKAQGELRRAELLYWESLTIRRKLAESAPTNAQIQNDLAIALDEFGKFWQSRGDAVRARGSFELALGVRRKLTEANPGNMNLQFRLASNLERIGDFEIDLGDFDRGKTLHIESASIRRRVAKALPGNADAQRNVMVSCFKLAFIAEQKKDWNAAVRWYENAIQILDRMIEQGQNAAQSQNERAMLAAQLKAVQSVHGGTTPARAEKPRR